MTRTATGLARMALRSVGRDDLAARLEPNRRGDPKVGLLREQLSESDAVLVARAVDMAHRHRGTHRDPVHRWDHTARTLAADLCRCELSGRVPLPDADAVAVGQGDGYGNVPGATPRRADR